uniref:Putative RNA polymerase subunit LEF-4 n=1 Tax=Chelonus inanitus TaxID=49201 RepID=B9W4A4_9HYME|nr:putative RNA polymerase subunit LEF-4 [Chelonus inanitus]
MPEPNDVLALFAQFPRQGVNTPLLADDYPHRTLLFDPLNVNLNQNSTDNEFTIGVQFIITDNNGSCLLAPPLSNTDGFIVVCNNREYKFKIPTLDVRIRNELAYLDQSPMPIFNTKLLSTFLLNPNSVYEITLRKNQVIILRERFERQFTSNMDEFENFKKELAFMSRQLQLMN